MGTLFLVYFLHAVCRFVYCMNCNITIGSYSFQCMSLVCKKNFVCGLYITFSVRKKNVTLTVQVKYFISFVNWRLPKPNSVRAKTVSTFWDTSCKSSLLQRPGSQNLVPGKKLDGELRDMNEDILPLMMEFIKATFLFV